MAAQVHEALEFLSDLEALSFYGLSQGLTKVQKLLERADHAAVAKAPRPEDVAVADRKEELLEQQAQLRRAMGSLVEKPSLSKREKPLADAFLQEQLHKLESQAAATGEARAAAAAKAKERLQELIRRVREAKPVPDSKEVRTIEASIKQQEAEWKEVSPLYDKWQAGRHNFKSNADLQTFRRRYEDCKKGRETSGARLEKALCARRDEAASFAAAAADAAAKAGPGPGWSTAKKASAPPTARSGGPAARPSRPAAPARSAAWGSAVVSLAQRLRAEVGARVREEAKEEEEEDQQEDEGGNLVQQVDAEDDEGGNDGLAPPPPPAKAKAPPPVVPKQPPPLPANLSFGAAGGAADSSFVTAKAGRTTKPATKAAAGDLSDLANSRRWGGGGTAVVGDESEEELVEEVQESAAKKDAKQQPTYTASAKKKGKGKKKKGGGAADEDDGAAPAGTAQVQGEAGRGPSVAAWAAAAEAAISGSLLQELLRREAWAWPEMDAAGAEERFAELAERLPWTSPLGMVLPMSWTEFVSLEYDGGPKRTSKRGSAPWVLRLQKTIPFLLAHYVTILFFLTLLHALSNFGFLLFAAAAQAGLILAPAEAVAGALPGPARPRLLQVAHLLLWLAFLRSIWLMHLFVKVLVIGAVATHAYVLADVAEK